MTSRVGDVITRNVVSLRKHAQFKDSSGLTAAELMTRPAVTISPQASVAEAARTMHAKHVNGSRLSVRTADWSASSDKLRYPHS